jgi:hypothetical protein
VSPPGSEQFIADLLARSQDVSRRVTEWHEANSKRLDEIVERVRQPVRLANAWVDQHRPQIEAVLEGLVAFNQRIEQIEKDWKDAGLGYLVSPLGAGEQLFLTIYAQPGHAKSLFEFLEEALADEDFVESACAALDEAEVLTDVPRRHLQHGLRHLAEHNVFDAWPPLIIGLEGAFTDVAVAKGIAVRKGNHVFLADGNGEPLSKKIDSVEGIAAKLGLDRDTDFGEFLLRQVYGGEGNPFRHGSAQEGIRDRAVCLAVAVIGWLDAFVAPGSLDLFSLAVSEELAERHDAELATADVELAAATSADESAPL